jgi:nucleotide-binding universal stress UspA family protein
MASPDGDLTLLHVVDEDFVHAAVAAGMGTTEEIRTRLKEQAESSFPNVLEGIEVGQVKIARDLDLPMIVMGIQGQSTPAEELLFGSTAEKVLRGTRVPVLCVPL